MRSPEGVAKTALGVAMVRARESRREDRLFDDPYAQAFLDASPNAFPEQPATAGPLASLGAVFQFQGVIRTRFYDDCLTEAAATCRQVVLLAAGLDTRAFRLPWPAGTSLFELDLPEVLTFKERVLADAPPRRAADAPPYPRTCAKTGPPACSKPDSTTTPRRPG